MFGAAQEVAVARDSRRNGVQMQKASAASIVLCRVAMKLMTSSACGRFVVLDGLHLDRHVFETFEQCATSRGLRVQDAIQLALCAFSNGALAFRAGADAAHQHRRAD